MRGVLGVCFVAAVFGLIEPAAGNTYPVIVKGTVVMKDGSPLPKPAGIERECSDIQGSAPGPITDKKGKFLWRMEIDAFRTRACVLRATLPGYVSTTFDISGINATSHDTTAEIPPLVLTPRGGDYNANIISVPGNEVPSRAKAAWKTAMKAVDTGHLAEASAQMKAAVDAAPQFAQGWNALGMVDDNLGNLAEARDAYEHAIKADPKLLPPYLGLARLCIKIKEWDSAAKAADTFIKADPKRLALYPEIYLHQAVARYELKDLDGALASVQEAIKLDPNNKMPRAEYVLGRILEAKGDPKGAREHISKYLELDPKAADAELIKAHLQYMGKPEGAGVEPDLEIL